jgi:tetratricopeptide (TPR) repeat protein
VLSTEAFEKGRRCAKASTYYEKKNAFMTHETCEVCGKELTKWNHAWGTNKCAPCAKGRLPEAKRHKEARDIERFLEPFSSLDVILHSSLSRFLAKSAILLFLMNAVALGGQIAADVTHNDNLILIQILAVVIGINLGSHVLFVNSHLLDVKRWRAFWRLDILGYVLGYCLFSFITAMLRASSLAHRAPLTPMQANIAQLSIVLPACVGIVFGALQTAATDNRRKRWVATKWGERDGTGCYNSGRIKQNRGDVDGAIADYSRAIQLKPDYVDAYVNRGLAKKTKGDLAGAIEDYSKAIELKPDFAYAYDVRGVAKKAKGDLEGANADHSKSIELKLKAGVSPNSSNT